MSHMPTKKTGQIFPHASFTDLKQLILFLCDVFPPLLSLSRPLWVFTLSWSYLYENIEGGRDGLRSALTFHIFPEVDWEAPPPTCPPQLNRPHIYFLSALCDPWFARLSSILWTISAVFEQCSFEVWH